MRTCAIIVAVLAAAIGTLIATSPAGVTPAHVPSASPTTMLPPWPVFRVAIALNEFFEAAAVATRPPPVQIKSLATAYWQSEVAYSLTKSGIIDELGKAGGVTCAAVASSLGLVHDFACRMMNAGVGVKLLAEDAKVYTLTGAGDMLRADHPASLRDFMLMINEETKSSWRAAGNLKTKASGFRQAFDKEFWEWHSEPAHSMQMAQFDGAMKAFSGEMSGSLLSDWAPPTPNATVCDIGGSVGHMLVAMAEHYPDLKGMVFDLPPVAERAAKNIQDRGLSERVQTVKGSFFEPLPEKLGQCDVFYMKFIIHDWDDADCVKILRNIAAVGKKGAKVVTCAPPLRPTVAGRQGGVRPQQVACAIVSRCCVRYAGRTSFSTSMVRPWR